MTKRQSPKMLERIEKRLKSQKEHWMGFYTQMYHQMQISAQAGRSMDAPLDVTKSA